MSTRGRKTSEATSTARSAAEGRTAAGPAFGRRRLGTACALTALLLAPVVVRGEAPALRPPPLPPIVLWAWERSEDLGFVDPDEVAVAYHAGTVLLSGDDILVAPRRHSLRVPMGTTLVPVVRLEADPLTAPALSRAQRGRAVEAILALSGSELSRLQVDFDAVRSQRHFYRLLLEELQRELPDQAITIAALASWCLGDRWLNGLPIVEAVPMLYRMGREGEAIRHHLGRGGDFASQLCRSSIGLSSDEEWPQRLPERRLYFFHPRPWTAPALAELVRRARQRQR